MYRRAATVFAAALAIVLLLGTAASAHVTIENGEQPAGGFAVLHFQVPNESDSASTTKLVITMPTDPVIPSVLARTSGAWKATVETRQLDTPVIGDDGQQITEVVSQVTFDGGSIPPGQFDLFDLSVGPLPDTPGASLAFPAVQTYDNGDVVRWIDPVVAGQPEPEHAAPQLKLTAASGSSSSPSSPGGDDHGALAVTGVVLGAVGVVLGAVALVLVLRRGRATASPQ